MADLMNQNQPQTPRMKALQNLANQLPVSNSRIVQGQQAARDLQLQAAVKAAPQGTNTVQAAQQTGAQVAQNAGAQLIDNAQNQLKQQGQVGQLGLQQQAQESQSRIADQQAGAREQSMDNVQRLASISENAKQELYDRQMKFEKDETGRTLFNERQLADYARLNAQSDEDFKYKAQQAEQISRRKLQAMEQAYRMVQEDLTQRQAEAEQRKDQASARKIAEMKIENDKQMQAERNRAANNMAGWTAGGTIVGAAGGAVIGSVVPGAGTALGASIGASVGGAAGGMIGSQTS